MSHSVCLKVTRPRNSPVFIEMLYVRWFCPSIHSCYSSNNSIVWEPHNSYSINCDIIIKWNKHFRLFAGNFIWTWAYTTRKSPSLNLQIIYHFWSIWHFDVHTTNHTWHLPLQLAGNRLSQNVNPQPLMNKQSAKAWDWFSELFPFWGKIILVTFY